MVRGMDISIRTRRGKVFLKIAEDDLKVEYPMSTDEAREIGEALVEAADAA